MKCETSDELLLVQAECQVHYVELPAKAVWAGEMAKCGRKWCRRAVVKK